MKIILGLLAVPILIFSFPVFAKSPDCTDSGAWPASMAYAELKNAEIIDSDTLDFEKTRVVRLASERIGKDPIFHKGLYRQVHRVTFVKKSGETLAVITVNDASHQECSMSDVDVYVVSKRLGLSQEKK